MRDWLRARERAIGGWATLLLVVGWLLDVGLQRGAAVGASPPDVYATAHPLLVVALTPLLVVVLACGLRRALARRARP